MVAIAVGARNMLGSRRDEVIERLERTTHGMDLLPIEQQKTPEKTLARIASILRPFARLATPSQGEELSRIQTSLIRAGYRNDNAVEVFLGDQAAADPDRDPAALADQRSPGRAARVPDELRVAMIACAIAFFLPNIWV